jgi:imidazolonepropionase-like amidohydrolase
MKSFIIRNASVLTMSDSLSASPQVTDIVIEDGRISRVEPNPPVSTGAESLDLSGKYLMPGLIDAHCHITYSGGLIEEELRLTPHERVLRASHNAFVTLLAGITTIRDPGGVDHMDVAVRNMVNLGFLYGPRILAGGRMIAITGGHGWEYGLEADGPDAVRRAVREQIKAHCDWVKFMASGGFADVGENPGSVQLDPDELTAGVNEAKKAGKRCAAHAHSAAAIRNAVVAGVDSIEHATEMEEDVIKLILTHGVHVVPTFSIYHKMMRIGAKRGIDPSIIDLTKRWWDVKVDRFVKAYKAGVKVVAGTDNGSPVGTHGDLTTELEILVQMGLSPYEALKAATISAAQMLGLQREIGTIEPGKFADLVVLSEDPTKNVAATRMVEKVFRNGWIYETNDHRVTLPATPVAAG